MRLLIYMKSGIIRCWLIVALFLTLAMLQAESGQGLNTWEVDTEVYAPIRADRQLVAVHQSVLFNRLFPAALDYTVGYGLLAVGMMGSMIDLYDGHDITYPGVWTAGIGPQFLFRGESLRLGELRADLNLAGAIILHGPVLPPRGSWYDFVWKVGLGFTLPGDPGRWHFGVRWYHMSNGQGAGPQNPSCEGLGLVLGIEILPVD
jgi:hypothetical protein